LSLQGALGRLLGIALSLIAVSVGVFWAAATFQARAHPDAAGRFAKLPLFFNAHVTGVRELSLEAMRRVARGGPDAEIASRELVKLGGAALPYVLPALDSLDPESRVRVALALSPIAMRMDVGRPDELENGAQAVLYWTRFWQDRAIDFREQAVRHLTARLAERAIALRREDLLHVDTFAVPSLIEQLGTVNSDDDVARVRRLSSVLAHVTERPPALPENASLTDAREVVETWRDFWQEHDSEFSTLDGPRRLTATFVETRYGKWLADVLRGGLGRTLQGETAWAVVRRGLFVTSMLLLIGLGGGFSLGVLWTRSERQSRKHAPRYASAIVGTALAAVPCATWVGALSGRGAGLITAVCLVTLTTAAWVSRHLARSTFSRVHSSPLTAAFSISAPLGATYPPFVLSGIVLAELGFQLPGVGRTAAQSLASGDVNAWMAASLTLALATLVLRQIADWARPRLSLDHESEP